MGNNKLNIDEYKVILNCINKQYIEYCKSWSVTRRDKFNLKKKTIFDIYNKEDHLNIEFKGYIHSFREKLLNLYFSIISNIQINVQIDEKVKFSGRVKTEDSILNKIYKKSKEADGKFPINSCINDLLGLRIIDPYYKDNINNIINELNNLKTKGYKIRHMDRINNGYKAYHIYFKKDNTSFPIELQIWDSQYEISNIESHKKYKQNYVRNIIENYNNI